MIRVLVAEDSAAVRGLLVGILSGAQGVEVVGEAATGVEAVRLTEQLRPDVVTMDIHMPLLDGLAATEIIMRTAPTPIVIVSSAVQPHDLDMTMRALQVGAVTAIPKPQHPDTAGFEDYVAQLIETVKSMAQVKVVRRSSAQSRSVTPDAGVPVHSDDTAAHAANVSPDERQEVRLVAIVASTGGPAALQTILSELPANFSAPILVVQHIADGFVPAMAGWLSQTSKLPVVIAEQGVSLQRGVVYVAPSAIHLGVAHDRIVLSGGESIGGFRPSGSHLFRAAAAYGSTAMGVILTGMGRDGVDGLRTLHAAGGFVIAQDEKSSVVFGMPAEAIRAGIVDRVLPIGQIAAAIEARVGAR